MLSRTKLAFFGVLVLAIGGCMGTDPSVISNIGQYNNTIKEVEVLTKAGILGYAQGVERTDDQKADLEKSLPLIEELYRFRPTSSQILALKGRALLALDRNDEAEKALLEGVNQWSAVLLNTENEIRNTMYYDLANISFERGEYPEALERVEKALELGPDNLNCLVYKARILIQAGEESEALKVLDRVLELNPGDSEAELLKKFLKTSQGSEAASP
ncbi:MAG: tetratricopeptide repeat protein [Fimbriimonadaceae bacterium]